MKPAPLQTEEEIQMVKDCMITPVLLDVLEHDMKALSLTNLKLPAIYRRKFRALQKEAALEYSQLRQRLRKRGIKIFAEQRTKRYLLACYKCRGYEHEMLLLWDIVKAEIEIRLSRYLNIALEDEEESS